VIAAGVIAAVVITSFFLILDLDDLVFNFNAFIKWCRWCLY